jgi:hypothetical protein
MLPNSMISRPPADLVDFDSPPVTEVVLGVERAINQVLIAEAVGPLVERLEVLKSEIPSLQAALHAVRMRSFVRRGSFYDEVRELALPTDVDQKISRTCEVGLIFNALSSEQHPAAAAVREACAALRRDADAELPS